MKRKTFLITLILFAVMGFGYITFRAAMVGQRYIRDYRSDIATRQVEYPWHYYPLSEESKQALCRALMLPQEHKMCRHGVDVMFREAVSVLRETFPEGNTPYSLVEERLGGFPHIKQQTDDYIGHLNSIDYVYQITEYEGACVFFQIDLNDLETVDRIYSSHLENSQGGPPTKCW